jgi:hypothetical protein
MSFLICDSYLESDPAKPDSFVISGFLSPVTTPATVNADGSVELHYDLTPEPNGSYTVTVEASLKGVLSAGSAAFTFTLPVVVTPPLVPGVPQNVRISAT